MKPKIREKEKSDFNKKVRKFQPQKPKKRVFFEEGDAHEEEKVLQEDLFLHPVVERL